MSISGQSWTFWSDRQFGYTPWFACVDCAVQSGGQIKEMTSQPGENHGSRAGEIGGDHTASRHGKWNVSSDQSLSDLSPAFEGRSTLRVTRGFIASLLTWQEKFLTKNSGFQAPGVNLLSPNVKTISLRIIISVSGRFIMDLQIKLFSGLDRGNHVIIITRGSIDIEGFRELFRSVVNTTRSLLDCKVLIDLQDATYKLEPGDIRTFADNLRPEQWPPTNRVALVSEPETQDYRQLCVLSTFLSNRAIKNAVFKDTRTAVSWLADAM